MSKQNEKYPYYATLIAAKLQELFDKDDACGIDLQELIEDDQITEFMFAVACVAPAFIYNKFTQQDVDYLEFNHIANKLCFQFCQVENESKQLNKE